MNPGQLHVHTRASDGEITPELVMQANLGFVAITDHDSLSGIESFFPLAQAGIEVIAGIELTVTFDGRQAHVLVLQPEPQPGFEHALEVLQTQRRQRLDRIVQELEGEGFCLDQLNWTMHHLPTKWDIGDAVLAEPANGAALERMGISNVKSFGRYFFDQRRANNRIDGLPAEELLPLVNGVFILAHPGKSFDLTRDASLVRRWLQSFPFAGLEVVTRKHRPAEQALAGQLALECNLTPVVSNDAHCGAHLFENQTPAVQLAQLQLDAANRIH